MLHCYKNITVNNHDNLPGEIQFLLQKLPKLIRPRSEQPLMSNTKVTLVIDTGDRAPAYVNLPEQSEEKYNHKTVEILDC